VDLALASLCRQTANLAEWEVLVVENDIAATPAMVSVCQRYMSQLPLRHIVESKVGLSQARNTGIREAKGSYVAFLDDDAEADVDWLSIIIHDCKEYNPDFFGGPSYPLYRAAKPNWYLDRYATAYMYGGLPRWLRQHEWLGGMNFIVKRQLCVRLGGFRTDLGMSGKTVAYGEDTEIQVRAWASNPELRVRYAPQASVHHEVRPEKMTLRWKIRATWAGGRSHAVTSSQKRKRALVGFIGNTARIVARMAYFGLCCRCDKEKRLCWQQWVFEDFCPCVWHLSYNWHSFFRY
jgi:hypothetical protein